ncbi:MAG: hypothetical protein ACYTBJ_27195, partial [Planctomycetota bacterium]
MLFFGHYGGTVAATVATPNNVTLGDMHFYGHDGVGTQKGAGINVTSVGLWSALNRGTKLTFSSTPQNTVTTLDVLLVEGDGSLTLRTGVSAPIKLQAGYHGGSSAVEISATANVDIDADTTITVTYDADNNATGSWSLYKGPTLMQNLNASGDFASYTAAG